MNNNNSRKKYERETRWKRERKHEVLPATCCCCCCCCRCCCLARLCLRACLAVRKLHIYSLMFTTLRKKSNSSKLQLYRVFHWLWPLKPIIFSRSISTLLMQKQSFLWAGWVTSKICLEPRANKTYFGKKVTIPWVLKASLHSYINTCFFITNTTLCKSTHPEPVGIFFQLFNIDKISSKKNLSFILNL